MGRARLATEPGHRHHPSSRVACLRVPSSLLSLLSLQGSSEISHLLEYLAEQVVNGAQHPGAVGPPPAKVAPAPPPLPPGADPHIVPAGWRDYLLTHGPEKWAQAVREHRQTRGERGCRWLAAAVPVCLRFYPGLGPGIASPLLLPPQPPPPLHIRQPSSPGPPTHNVSHLTCTSQACCSPTQPCVMPTRACWPHACGR